MTDDALILWSGSTREEPDLQIAILDVAPLIWSGTDVVPGWRHLLLGNDPARWVTGARAFSRLSAWNAAGLSAAVTFRPAGVTLTFSRAKWDEPVRLRLKAGHESMVVASDDGSLHVKSERGVLTIRRPVAASDAGAPRFAVRVPAGSMTVLDLAIAGPKAASTTVSTSIEWSSFLGGSDDEFVEALAMNGADSLVVAGRTHSVDFPVTPGAFDLINEPPPTGLDAADIYVCRFLPDGSGLDFATYLGGMGGENIRACLLDEDGSITIVGSSGSTDYPITPGALKSRLGPGQDSDVVLTRLSGDGTQLVWSTFLGGSSVFDAPGGAALLEDGSVIVAGTTNSLNFPVTDGSTFGGGDYDGFLARVDPAGASLLFSRYVGGSTTDAIGHVARQLPGRLAVTGDTASPDFSPFTPGSFSQKNNGFFIATVDDQTGAFLEVTAMGGDGIGGLGGDGANALACDTFGNVYVAGQSNSFDFPTTLDAFQPRLAPSLGAPDGFISVFDPTLSHLLHSTFLGGNLQDWIDSLVVDSSGLVTVAGITNSTFFPVTEGAFDTSLNGFQGHYDAFVSRLDRKLQHLHYSTFLGGTGTENLTQGKVPVAVAPDGRVAVAVGTNSTDFPLTPGAFDTTLDGEVDIAVVLMNLLPTGVQRVGAATPGSAGLPVMSVTAVPDVGAGEFALTCAHVPPLSSGGFLLLSLAASDRPVKAAGVDLWLEIVGLFVVAPVASDDYGYVEVPLRIPPDPALAGLQAAGQFAWSDAASPGGKFSASNALVVTIQP